MKIALVEDHDALRLMLIDTFHENGYRISGFDSAEALDEALVASQFDLFLLDLNLPGEDGISITRRLKRAHPNVYVIMMTARGSELDKVKGYDSGADIYLTKPVSQRELLAAVKSISRRIAPDDDSKFCLDLSRMMVIGQESIEVGKTECTILKAMIEAQANRLEYWRILEAIGKEVTEASKAALEVQIVRLRKKLIAAGMEKPAIKALHKEGYQLLGKFRVSE